MQTCFFQIQATRLFWLFTGFITLLAALHVPKAEAAYQAPLSDIQRRAYLKYYAPVIMKMADEDSTKTSGRDWITNFDYDRDGMFSSNRKKWEDGELQGYVKGAVKTPAWAIRPTLYTALLEFQETESASKSVVLMYHVYHAMEDGEIHDWERIEIRVDNVSGKPGSDPEKLTYVVATQHTMHVPRLLADVKFMETASGKHALILQGPWTDGDGAMRKNELRHVVTPWATLAAALGKCIPGSVCPAATVDVTNGSGTKLSTGQRVNYVFVPGTDKEAVGYWGAQAVTKDRAAKTNKTVTWDKVVRLTYELQDIADIMQTHAVVEECGSFPTEHKWKYHPDHWIGESVQILMENNIYAEPGNPGVTLVPTSANCANKKIVYFLNANDDGSVDKDAQSYPNKHWFWGSYITGIDGGSYTDEAFAGKAFYDSSSATVAHVRNCSDGIRNKYWCQHDYFAHRGIKGNDSSSSKLVEPGIWLPEGWHTPLKGGFDGRWVQLFGDRYAE